ncbi:unnamed protein product [Linum trigynum]|uniref:Uncharacterized protein n=1 Tax=Linum trigynum TaxID=586398 RepID=A0AAV2CGR9_9ROSI
MCSINARFNSMRNAHQYVENTSLKARKAIQTKGIFWKPPLVGWIQIQSDESVHNGIEKAARLPTLSRCNRAFICNLESYYITYVDLKGAIEGLKIAWEEDIEILSPILTRRQLSPSLGTTRMMIIDMARLLLCFAAF